jgi:hypothetical protein
MRTLAALITAFLLIVPAAQAKEIRKVRACGVNGCVTTHDDAVLQGMMNGGPPSVPPPTDGAAYRLTSAIVEPGHGVVARMHSWWVPSLHMLVAEDGTWMPLDPGAVAALESVTRNLKAIPGTETGLAVSAPAPQPAAHDDGGGTDRLPILLGAAALAAIAAIVVFVLRRRPRGDFPVPAP